MITGVLFYEKDLEGNLKFFLEEGIKIFRKKHDHKVTAIALNRKQFEADEECKSVLAFFSNKGITVLLLNDINKNNYQVGYRD